MSHTEASGDRVWRHRWLIVMAAGALMGLALGIRHVHGLLLQPVVLDRGWTREVFSLSFAVQNLVWGLAQPFAGMAADRHGAFKVLVAGALLYIAGLVLMTFASTPTTFIIGDGLLVGLGLSGTAFAVVYGALSRLFPAQRRGWALGLAGAVGGLGQFLLVPATQSLLSTLPWQSVALALAVLMLLALPLSLALRGDVQAAAAANQQQTLADALREAFSHRGFWLLNLGFLACGFQLAFIGAHLPSYLLDRGLGLREAGACLAIIALANVLGTWLCTWAGEWMRRKYALSLLYLARSAAMAVFILMPLSVASAWLFSFLMGLMWLGTVPLTSGLLAQVFGVRYLSTLFGFVFVGHQIGGFLGSWLGGAVFVATGSYDALWYGAIAIGLVAALLHWPIDDRQLTRPAGPVATAQPA